VTDRPEHQRQHEQDRHRCAFQLLVQSRTVRKLRLRLGRATVIAQKAAEPFPAAKMRTAVVVKGWTVADEHVYCDDGISGAEFERRPGFIRLMAALKPRAPFNVPHHVGGIAAWPRDDRSGLRAQAVLPGRRRGLALYLEDRERKMDTPTEKLLMSVSSFVDEIERQTASQRTADAMRRKAEAGHVTGGRVFGYDNVDVLADSPDTDGRRKRLHVERRVNEAEAAVVRAGSSNSARMGKAYGPSPSRGTMRGRSRPSLAARTAIARGHRRACGPSSTDRCIAASSSGTRPRNAMRGAGKSASTAQHPTGSGSRFPRCGSWTTSYGRAPTRGSARFARPTFGRTTGGSSDVQAAALSRSTS
jgi:DNA invertase Pin-like site-specific DNA recombinase